MSLTFTSSVSHPEKQCRTAYRRTTSRKCICISDILKSAAILQSRTGLGICHVLYVMPVKAVMPVTKPVLINRARLLINHVKHDGRMTSACCPSTRGGSATTRDIYLQILCPVERQLDCRALGQHNMLYPAYYTVQLTRNPFPRDLNCTMSIP